MENIKVVVGCEPEIHAIATKIADLRFYCKVEKPGEKRRTEIHFDSFETWSSETWNDC
jgi:hypothetical protein